MCVTANLVSRIPSLRFTRADYESIRSDGCNTWTVGSSWVT